MKDGQKMEDTCFVDIVVWGKTGEVCQRNLTKGSQIVLEGRLQYEQWEDRQTARKNSRLRVVAKTVQFCGKRKDKQDGNTESSGGYPAPAQQQTQPPMPGAGPGRYTQDDYPSYNRDERYQK